jgi:hypothetical protein
MALPTDIAAALQADDKTSDGTGRQAGQPRQFPPRHRSVANMDIQRLQIRRIHADAVAHRLLTGNDGGAWIDAARSITDTVGDAYQIGYHGDLTAAERPWTEAYRVTKGGAALSARMGFVVWRSIEAANDPAGDLGDALATGCCWLICRMKEL